MVGLPTAQAHYRINQAIDDLRSWQQVLRAAKQRLAKAEKQYPPVQRGTFAMGWWEQLHPEVSRARMAVTEAMRSCEVSETFLERTWNKESCHLEREVQGVQELLDKAATVGYRLT